MSIRIISQNYSYSFSLLTKNAQSFDVALLHPPSVDCLPFPWIFMGNPKDVGKSYPKAKNLLNSHTREIPLHRFTPSAIKSTVINLSFIWGCSHFCCIISFFNFRLYTYVMLLLMKGRLLNVVLSMTKALIVKALQCKISILSTFQSYLDNSASLNACFLLFQTTIFISKSICLSWPHFSWDFVHCEPIKYNGFQLSGDKSYKTSYLMS